VERAVPCALLKMSANAELINIARRGGFTRRFEAQLRFLFQRKFIHVRHLLL
jgi:hypothetical protein